MRVLLLVLALAAPHAHAQTGRIQIVHTSPDPALRTLDVYLNDELRPELDGLGFREATPWLEFPAGRAISVVVTRPGSAGQVPYVGTQTVVVEDSVDQYLLIDGILQDVDAPQPGLAFRVGRLRMGRGRARFGSDPLDRYTRVGIYHAAPDMGAYTYDLFASADGSGLVVQAPVDYGQATGFIHLPAGDYVFRTRGIPEFGAFTVSASQVGARGDGDTVLLFFSGYVDGEARGLPGLGFHAVLGDGTVRDLYPIAIPSGASPAQGLAGLRVAPNPVRGRSTLRIERDAPGVVRVEIVDTLGRVVWRGPSEAVAAGETALALDTDGLAPGPYGIRLVDARGAVRAGVFTVAR